MSLKIGSWKLEVKSSRELAAEGTSDWRSQRSEFEVGVIWSPLFEDVSLEAKNYQPLEAVTKQLDWGYYSVNDSDLCVERQAHDWDIRNYLKVF
jgi:hypothetical protein